MPAMLGCSTICPRCQHQFVCCSPTPCCTVQRSLHALSGGGLVAPALTAAAAGGCASPQVSPSAAVTWSGCASPQVSPSGAVTFVLPSFITPFQPPQDALPETELKRLADTVRALRLSGWYYEGISYQRSHDLLQDKAVGTFLVRESTDPRFLFSLSVQTDRGPTSVRIHYVSGYFRLDAQIHLQDGMPLFPSVVDLVLHYVTQTRNNAKNSAQVWVDPRGKLYSAILLDKPLRRSDGPPSLKHLARLTVHRALQNSTRSCVSPMVPPHTQLELPPSLTDYLSEYPYSL